MTVTRRAWACPCTSARLPLTIPPLVLHSLSVATAARTMVRIAAADHNQALCCPIVQLKTIKQRIVSFRSMEDVETRFKLALQYIDKGGLAAQHPGQSPPSNEVLLEYYAYVLTAAPCRPCLHPCPSPCHASPRRLYKQAHLGDCREREPWKIQAIAYHKWWAPATSSLRVRWRDACVFGFGHFETPPRASECASALGSWRDTHAGTPGTQNAA